MHHLDSYDSEGKYVGKHSRRATDQMANGDSAKVTWEWIFKLVQVIVVPLLIAVLYQMTSMDRRLTIIESKPTVDMGLIQKIAVMEDRQNEVRLQLKENGGKLDRLENILLNHDDRWERTKR